MPSVSLVEADEKRSKHSRTQHWFDGISCPTQLLSHCISTLYATTKFLGMQPIPTAHSSKTSILKCYQQNLIVHPANCFFEFFL